MDYVVGVSDKVANMFEYFMWCFTHFVQMMICLRSSNYIYFFQLKGKLIRSVAVFDEPLPTESGSKVNTVSFYLAFFLIS